MGRKKKQAEPAAPCEAPESDWPDAFGSSDAGDENQELPGFTAESPSESVDNAGATSLTKLPAKQRKFAKGL